MNNISLTSFIWPFIKKQWGKFFVIFLVSFVWALDNTVWPYILKVVIDIFSQYEFDRAAAWPLLKTPLLMALFLWLFVEFGFRLQGFLLARAMPRLEADIRMKMFEHIQRHSPHYFNDRFAGSLANKITDMTTQVSQLINLILTLFIPAVAACSIAIVLFAYVSPMFAVILSVWMVVHVTVSLAFTKRVDSYEQAHSESRSSLLGKIVDSFTNNFAVNLFYNFAYERSYIEQFQKEERQKNYRAKRYVEVMRLVLGFFTFLGAGLGLSGLMVWAWLQGWISTGQAAQVFNTAWNITMVLWIASWSIPTFFQAIGICKQALVMMRDPQDIQDTPGAKPLVISKGEIIFDKVNFYYGKKKLFENKDVHIRGGEKIGLVGKSGAGKSTFVNLILRLYQVDSGQILIDGMNISQASLESLRKQIALIPQDPVLFHRTLRENIRYGRPNATDEELYEAAKLAHCDEFIRKMPSGYDTLVGERGTKLSGGERQRIAIARAILANTPILILDEATSALDSVTEQLIQESLNWLMENRTTIAIAHRLSTLSCMDRILVFDQGRIVEDGSHRDLLAEETLYAKMWQMQAGAFLPDDEEWEEEEEEEASEVSSV
jgi:ATP-binding cassette subfamily B protein